MFEALDNFRDFGGYATASGRPLKTGLLFRSAHHGNLTPGDLEVLAGHDITTIVDLRRAHERKEQPSRRWPGFAGAVIENDLGDTESNPWLDLLGDAELTPANLRGFMVEFYRTAPLEERHLDLYTRYFAALEQTAGATLVHCAGGKDRTGIIVALTHHLAGVAPDQAVHDFLLTNEQSGLRKRGPNFAGWIERRIGRRPSDEAAVAALLVDEGHIHSAFGAMTEAYGSVDAYLEQALGVTPVRKAAILDRLLG